jgi:hypothetical protein
MSKKEGPMRQNVFTNKEEAQRSLEEIIKQQFGDELGGSEVFFIPINDEMREAFSGPVAPFHYDPNEDPDLKEVYKRFGAKLKKKSFVERWDQFKAGLHDEIQQGVFDSFYGLKRAMRNAGIHVSAANDPYIQARFSTSVDSMMKGILMYGHAVWKEGIVQNEGKGLVQILKPIMSDTKPFEAFMYGRRAKRLMLEGYAALNPEMKAKIDAAAKQFGTGPDSVFEVLVKYHALELYNHTEVQAGDLTKSDRAALSDIENKFWADFLPHTKREMQPKKGSTTKAPAGRWQIFDWRVPSKRNTQQNIDSKYRMATKALMGRGYNVKSEAEARKMVDRLTDLALVKQEQSNAMREVRVQAASAAAALIGKGREHRFDAAQLDKMIKLGDYFPIFHQVAADWAVFNKGMLDFAEKAGTVSKEGRAIWDHAECSFPHGC